MAKRRRHKPGKPDPMEVGEKRSRCPWDGRKANDALISQNWSQEAIGKQRRRARHWVEPWELSWDDLIGSK